MLSSLFVQNYALIRELKIEFGKGLSIISGETGAGKSILLGALSLILGQRADTSVLLDKTGKCIVEGEFDLTGYGLESLFRDNDLDYERITILRREINQAGKSRAFVNDSPVPLTFLKELGMRLVDIHSQHENLALGNHLFQMKVVDTFAGNNPLLEEYENVYRRFREIESALENLKNEAEKNRADLDYFQFQFEQLEKAALAEGEQEDLETELQTLLHAEEIRGNLLQAHDILGGDELPILGRIREVLQLLQRISTYHPPAEELSARLEPVLIELKDLSEEMEKLGNSVEYDPQRIELVQQRLDLIYSLLQKHRLERVTELIALQNELRQKIETIESYDLNLEMTEKELAETGKLLDELAMKLREKRFGIKAELQDKLMGLLHQMGMPHGNFSIMFQELTSFTPSGKEQVSFLFSANKQASLMDISRVASGGELSRLMLCLKSILTRSMGMPTIIFDEIDAGVSGEIADKVGKIIQEMSEGIQVINITHLPQIASKGQRHYLVYKTDEEDRTRTQIRLLSTQERIHEIARMLSGEELSEAAYENARALLKN